jgi:lipopolysaccharide assembly outer membrane protein LptD (OstA)
MIRSLAVLFGALSTIAPLAQAPTPAQAPAAKPAHSTPPKAAAPRPSGSPATTAAPASFDVGVWTVHASSLDANFKTGDFSTPAKIVMTRVGGDVTADRADGNYKKQVLNLNGHVVMHDQQGSAASVTAGSSPHPSSPSTLTADKAQIDGAAKLYKAVGNVHYVQADTVVTADTGTLDAAAHNLLLEGAVHIVSGTRKMNARKVLYNTESGSAHAEGDVTMQFPSEFHRTLATPRPLKIPKNALTQPVGPASPP